MKNNLSVNALSFSRMETPVLKGLDFSTQPGERIGLIGPNGAGKSTLLKLLIKLLTPDSGHITLNGTPYTAWSQKALARTIAYLPQNPVLADGFSALEVVMMGRYARLGRFESISKKDEQLAWDAMSETESVDFAHRQFNALSGGEQQRVLLARALSQEAQILLLDEPTASLDLHHQLHFFKLLQSIEKTGRTVLLAIHDLNLAARYCNRLILLHQGKLVSDGTPETVLTSKHLLSVYGISAEISRNQQIDRLSVLPLSIHNQTPHHPKKAPPYA